MNPALIEARENVAYHVTLPDGVVVGDNLYDEELYRCSGDEVRHYQAIYSQPYRED